MTPKALRDEILRLPPGERFTLLEEVWDTLAATPGEIPVPDWHKEALDRRLDNPSAGAALAWDDVRKRLRDRTE
ncbi:MAG TPA: addiction module protein [Gemmatimonadales bacterium]|jgi:putative addiction module component (TIGR02574 family)|nr:addiction module protein [Gemmatimonadales bacterium]